MGPKWWRSSNSVLSYLGTKEGLSVLPAPAVSQVPVIQNNLYAKVTFQSDGFWTPSARWMLRAMEGQTRGEEYCPVWALGGKSLFWRHGGGWVRGMGNHSRLKAPLGIGRSCHSPPVTQAWTPCRAQGRELPNTGPEERSRGCGCLDPRPWEDTEGRSWSPRRRLWQSREPKTLLAQCVLRSRETGWMKVKWSHQALKGAPLARQLSTSLMHSIIHPVISTYGHLQCASPLLSPGGHRGNGTLSQATGIGVCVSVLQCHGSGQLWTMSLHCPATLLRKCPWFPAILIQEACISIFQSVIQELVTSVPFKPQNLSPPSTLLDHHSKPSASSVPPHPRPDPPTRTVSPLLLVESGPTMLSGVQMQPFSPYILPLLLPLQLPRFSHDPHLLHPSSLAPEPYLSPPFPAFPSLSYWKIPGIAGKLL